MSDVCLKLTAEELERYRGYEMMVEFSKGYDDYVLGHRAREPLNADSFGAQAYDRGAEMAMRRMAMQRKRDALAEKIGV